MIEVAGLVGTVVQGYRWLRVWHARQAQPAHLPANAILAFQRFKAAYDAKDVRSLAACISDGYQGDVFGARSKGELLRVQGEVFRRLLRGVYPCLSISVYNIIKDGPRGFSAILDTRSRATVLRIPLWTYDSAPLRCTIRPEGPYHWWRVTELFVQWDLVQR